MIRGGCQPFKFTLPCNWCDIVSVDIIFWQEGNDQATVEINNKAVCSTSGCKANEIVVTLNQAQTLAFLDDRKAYCQIKVLRNDGLAIPTKEIPITVYPTKITTILSSQS